MCAHVHTHTHKHTHTLPGLFRCHEMRGALSSLGLPDGESLRGQAGTDGLRTAGYWEWRSREEKKGESIDSQGPPSLLPTPEYTYHHPPNPHPVPPNSFAALWFSAVMNLQFAHICTLPYMVLLWDLFNPDGNIYKQVTTKSHQSAH